MKKTNKQNLIDHLKNDINLKKNDFVWLHPGVVGLGLLEEGIETITSAFEEVLSEGALFIPTFTYSWCENITFDPLTSECPTMGSYPSKAWKDSRFIRNNNPNFSVCMLKNTSNINLIEQVFTKGAEKSCFGKDSFFSNLYKLSKERNGYIVLLGGAHDDVLFRSTFLHYIEEKVGVPYRYIKRFYNPVDKQDFVEQLSRFLSKEEYLMVSNSNDSSYKFPIKEKYEKLGNDLINENVITRVDFRYSTTRSINIKELCDWLENKIRKDSEYLLK